MRTFVILPAFEIAPDWIEPVTGWSIADLKDHLQQSLTSDSYIRVICQDEPQLARLQTSFASIPDQNEVRLTWGTSKPHQLAQEGSPKLTIAAVASPDPTTVLWEDCSKPWVHALNMETAINVDPNESRCIQGPRYLMPADDTKWAVHEILSADQAMRCGLEAVEGF